jgi:hypothetical protein
MRVLFIVTIVACMFVAGFVGADYLNNDGAGPRPTGKRTQSRISQTRGNSWRRSPLNVRSIGRTSGPSSQSPTTARN